MGSYCAAADDLDPAGVGTALEQFRIVRMSELLHRHGYLQRRPWQAMIDTGSAHNAHPALWAPFVVVGEGGIRHAR